MSISIDGDALQPMTDVSLTGATVVGTPPSATGVTVLASGKVRHMVHKVRVDYTALTGFAALTGDVALWTAPAGAVIERVIAKVNTNFTGGAISACAMTVGNAAGGNQYLLSGSVFSATPMLGDVVAEIGAGLVDSTRNDTLVSATAFAAIPIQCRFTSVTANLSALTAGQVDVYILYKQLPV